MVLSRVLILAAVAGCSDAPERVKATKVDGVWVFSGPAPSERKDKLFSGLPSVVNGCLMVGKGIVVWRSDDLHRISSFVTAAKAGQTDTEVEIGGDVFPPSERPTIIGEKCSTDDKTIFWQAAREPGPYGN
jgi:hypothetical protein